MCCVSLKVRISLCQISSYLRAEEYSHHNILECTVMAGAKFCCEPIAFDLVAWWLTSSYFDFIGCWLTSRITMLVLSSLVKHSPKLIKGPTRHTNLITSALNVIFKEYILDMIYSCSEPYENEDLTNIYGLLKNKKILHGTVFLYFSMYSLVMEFMVIYKSHSQINETLQWCHLNIMKSQKLFRLTIKKYQSFTLLALCEGICQWLEDYPHKG